MHLLIFFNLPCLAEYQKLLNAEAQRQREQFEKAQQQRFVSDLETTIQYRQRTTSQSPARQPQAQRPSRRVSPGANVPFRTEPLRQHASLSPAPSGPRQPSPVYRAVHNQEIRLNGAMPPAHHESQFVIDAEMPAHKSRLHSQTDDDDQLDAEYRGEVMPPLIIQPLQDYKLTEGQDATFFCRVAGVPKPKVAWFKNGERLKASSRTTMKYSTDGYHTLRIRDTNINDEGVYLLHAVNQGGNATSMAQLCIDAAKNVDTSSHISAKTLTMLQRR